jgi:HPt (histidine-containing phosphotransfer) domain-containing protein
MGVGKGVEMNIKESAESLGLEVNELIRLIELFMDTGVADLRKLQVAIEAGNTQQVIEAAHAISGASGSLGFMNLQALAKGLEEKAMTNSLDGAIGAIREIKQEFDLLAEVMRGVLAD